MAAKKAGWGGAREGAGRPREKEVLGDEKQKVIFYLDGDTHRLLRRKAREKKVPQSVLIRQILKRSLERSA